MDLRKSIVEKEKRRYSPYSVAEVCQSVDISSNVVASEELDFVPLPTVFWLTIFLKKHCAAN